MSLLKVKGLNKTYTTRFSKVKTEALKDINFEIEKGEFVAIMGESGSGKTTLLNIVSLIDSPSGGEIYLNNKALEFNDKSLSKFRRKHIGFVFQDFNLLDTLNIKDNIVLPLVLSDVPLKAIEEKLDNVVKSLNLLDILQKFPYEISGGQKQRAAVARAIIGNPDILLADEPTGALDTKNSSELMNLFEHINNNGQTILMVTHSIKAASRAKRVMFIKDGIIYHQIYRGELSPMEMNKKISNTLSLMLEGGALYEE
ncbi:MAG: ABC transporter ATP-binding protein [Christensenellaceae bacterium]|nr:ABC transporter ATP-binding protein [Christensenellaceae bacterium]